MLCEILLERKYCNNEVSLSKLTKDIYFPYTLKSLCCNCVVSIFEVSCSSILMVVYIP